MELLIDTTYYQTVVIDKRIYIIHYKGSLPMLEYNLSLKVFEERTPMRKSRSDFCFQFCKGILYVFGGDDGGAIVSCEKYNLEKDIWADIAEMPCCPVYACCCLI